jgi:hypothetical protein
VAKGAKAGGVRAPKTAVVASPAAGPFHLHGGHLATHATDFLSSLVHEGVADFMSRSVTGLFLSLGFVALKLL